MEDPVKNAELKVKIRDAWDAYALANTEAERDQILERIGHLEADRCLVMPIEELRESNRKAGITDEMVRAMMSELHRRFPAIVGAPKGE